MIRPGKTSRSGRLVRAKAFAQGYGPWSGARMGPGMMYGNGRAAVIDQNDDGRISSEEAAAEDVFTAMDADDDGQIAKDEYMAVRMGPGWGWNTERQAAMQANKEAASTRWTLTRMAPLPRRSSLRRPKLISKPLIRTATDR